MNKFSSRELTPGQKEENEKEFARMRKMIPGNMFIPGSQNKDDAEKLMTMRKTLVFLGNKVRRGKASDSEKIKYYSVRMKELNHKIQFMEYTLKRIEERQKEENRVLVSDAMLKRNYKALEKMRKNLENCSSKLEDLKS